MSKNATKLKRISSKTARNENEKRRRDVFNQLISNLGAVLAKSASQLSKSAILRQALLFLKEQKSKKESPELIKDDFLNLHWKPASEVITTDEWFDIAIESMNCFLMILHFHSMENHQIIYVSKNVNSFFGYSPNQLLHQSFFQFIHSSHHPKLNEYFLRNHQVLNTCEIDWKQSRTDDYEQCSLIGAFRKCLRDHWNFHPIARCSILGKENEKYFFGIVKVNTIDRTMVCHEHLSETQFVMHINNHGRLIYVNSKTEEYLGYNGYELLGKTYFELVHPDDLPIISRAHRLWKSNEDVKSDPYRLLTKGQQWVFLQTSSRAQINSWTGKSDFYICTNSFLNCPPIQPSTNKINSKPSSSNEIQSFLCDIDNANHRTKVLQRLKELKTTKEAEIRVRKDEIQVIDDIIQFINQYRTTSTEENLLNLFDHPSDSTLFNSPLSGSIEDYSFESTGLNQLLFSPSSPFLAVLNPPMDNDASNQ